jgi:Mg2+/Co2+ transporter CorC
MPLFGDDNAKVDHTTFESLLQQYSGFLPNRNTIEMRVYNNERPKRYHFTVHRADDRSVHQFTICS